MAAWNLSGAIAAASSNSKPADFVFKIAPRSQPDAVYLSAKSLAAAKIMCGRRDVILLDGAIVFDPLARA
jgi:hypothetical protein